MSMRPGRIFQFGKFQIDALARTLRREETIVKLNSRAFDVLLYLVQNPGKVLTRDELLRNVWQDAFVDESSLPQTVSLVRRALEEKPGDNSYIVTLPGRGYQFASAVQVVDSEEVSSDEGNTFPSAATDLRNKSSGLIFQKHTVETSVITREEKAPLNSPISRSRLPIRAIATVLIAVLVVVLVVRFRSPRRHEPKPVLVERRLTANPPENPIGNYAISQDGKYLAYSDSVSKKLDLLAIDSGEIREVPLPGNYGPWDWFPDGNHLVMSADNGNLWKMSTLDSSLRKLWGGRATDEGLSPDGSHFAIVNDNGEIWLMAPDGEEPHKIVASDPHSLHEVVWSPTGQRIAYIRSRGTFQKPEVTIETCDVAGGGCVIALSNPHLRDVDGVSSMAWLPDGRIIYSIFSEGGESDLWAIRVDPGTGQPSGNTTQLTSGRSYRASSMTASADGKRLIVLKQHDESQIYIGDVTFGNNGFNPRRFTPDDWYNVVQDWTGDSKAILFHSNRSGRWAIFKQDIDAQTPEPLIAGPENYFYAKRSAQGTLLYLATASPNRNEPNDPTIRVMSTSEQGGARTTLMMGHNAFKCGSSPSSSCVVSEFADHQLVFFRLDPVKGKGEEITRVAGYQAPEPRWDLSPDGSKLAIVDPDQHKGEIRVLSLSDRRVTVLAVRSWKWSDLALISWAADGKSCFVEAEGSSNALLSVDANGNSKVLYEFPGAAGWISSIVPSPDGKRLAFTRRVYVQDVMLLENF
ncbi:MAG: winged helix-turn-helix domain-containing protein [Terriglobales bacterium]